MRLVKGLGVLIATLLLLINMPGASYSRAAAGCAAGNYHFWGLVAQGKDTGTVVEGVLAVTTATTPTLTLGDGMSANVNCTATGNSVSLQTSLGTLGSLFGTGRAAGTSWIGSFNGPRSGDTGTWRAGLASKSIGFALTGSVTKGPNKGMSVIGDLSAVVEADGTLIGRYQDNSNVGPGIVIKTYPVHGWYINNNLSAAILWSQTAAIFMNGHAGTFYGLQSLNGSLTGPRSGDSGPISGVAQ